MGRVLPPKRDTMEIDDFVDSYPMDFPDGKRGLKKLTLEEWVIPTCFHG